MSQVRQRTRPGEASTTTSPASIETKAKSDPVPQPWAPSARDALHYLLFVRIVGTVLYSLISDCDETFNYWEPTHMLLYGRGLQTWEYSPQYALRSYAYAGFHSLLAALAGGLWGADKVTIFHGTRLFLAAISATCEATFYRGILKRFGPNIARYALAGLVCSAGLLHASQAYLPSTWTMYGLLLTWGYWMEGNNSAAVWAAVVGLACGWPFAVVALAPLVLHIAVTACVDWKAVSDVVQGKANPLTALKPQAWSIAAHTLLSLALVLGLQACIDYTFYHSWLIAPWNIIKYNALGHGGGGQGSNLYGVEPWTYYAKNIALNFNVVALLVPLSLLAVALMAGRRAHGWDYAVCIVAQLFLWLAAMWPRPHKEERFLFPVYPLFPLAAAFSLTLLDSVLVTAVSVVATGNPLPSVRRFVLLAFAATTALLSASRIAALIDGFGAPFYAWGFLSQHLTAPGSQQPYSLTRTSAGWSTSVGARVCVGKEWYRFPASFYLPETTRPGSVQAAYGYDHVDGGKAELSFLKSGFGGLLPQAYLPPVPSVSAATRVNRTGYNDLNQEEVDRYVDVHTCDFVVDLELPVPRHQQDGAVKGYEPYFDASALRRTAQETCDCKGSTSGSERIQWRSIYSRPFVHAESSPALTRAFYIPGLSHKRNVYGTYHVLAKEVCKC